MRDADLPPLVVGDTAWLWDHDLLYVVAVVAVRTVMEGDPDAFQVFDVRGSHFDRTKAETYGRSYLYKLPDEQGRLKAHFVDLMDRARYHRNELECPVLEWENQPEVGLQ